MNFLKFLFCLLSFAGFAQKEAAQWYFGNYASLNFQSGAPVAVSTSSMGAMYSSSGIADSLGNLLFYTNAEDIWNKNNLPMANGQSIGGGDGTQTSIVIRKSGNVYYVITHHVLSNFTTSSWTNYALVDMSLAAGLGSVTASNLSLTPAGEPFVCKLAATKHCNQTDHWLLTHKGGFPGSNQYHAYLVTGTGISTNPVISAIGSNQPQGQPIWFRGVHKFSPNGKKVCANMANRTVELYDFNNSTGILTNVITLDSVITTNSPGSTGVEFSPDGSKLYVLYPNIWPSIYQFNLCAGSAAAIKASKTVVDTANNTVNYAISYAPKLQLGIDGKIYVSSVTNSVALGVINNPNAPGVLCNYVPQAVPLGTVPVGPSYIAVSAACLPNFISNFFEQKPAMPPLTSTASCGVASFASPTLCAGAGYSLTGTQWNFNDPLSGTSNISNLSNPTHSFSTNGNYNVKLVLQYPCGADTLKKTVTITGLPTLTVSGKTTICKGQNSTFTISGANTYSLNGVAMTQSSVVLQPTTTTVYTVTGFDPVTGCRSLKTISLSVSPCTGIDESAMKTGEDIKIYPNPNKGSFFVELMNEGQIQVTDLTGRVIYNQRLIAGKSELNLAEQRAGVYFITVKDLNGSQTFKLVME